MHHWTPLEDGDYEAAVRKLHPMGIPEIARCERSEALGSRDEDLYARPCSRAAASQETASSSTALGMAVVWAAEPAIDDANPTPRRASLALAPPEAIMCPAGDAAKRRRLSKALADDEVAQAQRLLASPRHLAELLGCEVFGRAAAAVGIPLRTIRRAADLATPAVTDAKDSVDHVKKLALVLAEYRSLLRRAATAEGRAAAGTA